MIQRILRTALAALLGCASIDAQNHSPGQFQHHADVRVELFAQEPDVVDPVSLTFAANGDCYVVEMRDYPYGFGSTRKPGGSIRLLRDRNGDGRVDESVTFAEGLSFPTSVLAWQDGVLVVAPPQILFLKDTDGDDRADVTDVVIDGLRLGVTDSNANSLRWGIDNLIHVANGGNGGNVRFAGHATPISLGNSDFAFDPNSKSIDKTFRTGGGFGLVFDAFGHSFTTYNINYLQQRIVPTKHADRNRNTPSFRGTENISDHGPSARIFPIVRAVTRVNHPEQAGHFSSAGGMAFLDQGPFSARLANSIFVCDVVCNLVHRDVLRDVGPLFRGARAPEEQDREFLASTDPAFRPVGLEHGPDGALYLLDMQRDVIEHPDYIPDHVRETLQLRGGENRGRIYRVVPRDVELHAPTSLDDASTQQLVQELSSPYKWRRTTAHRLLFNRGDVDSVAQIRLHGLHANSPEARAASLWLLESHQALSRADLVATLDDEHSGVRENAVELIERSLDKRPGDAALLLRAINDDHPRVRFRAMLSLDGVHDARKIDQLFRVLIRDYQYQWSRRAVWLAIDEDARPLLMRVWNSPEYQALPNDPDKHVLLSELADVAAATRASSGNGEFPGWLRRIDITSVDRRQASALLNGLVRGWQRRPSERIPSNQASRILAHWTAGDVENHADAFLDLAAIYNVATPPALMRMLAQARDRAMSEDIAVATRVAAVELLSRTNDDRAFELLMQLLSRPEPTSIQRAAITSIRQMGRADSAKQLLEIWPLISPGVRNDAVGLLLSRRSYHEDLLVALENETVRFAELNMDLEQRRRLLRSSDQEIRERAAEFFSDEEYSNRKEIVTHWLSQMPAEGDAAAGRGLFQEKCANCHVVRDQGHRVGPDLQALSHRSVEDLLTHILDPNMSINPNYVSCVVETIDGRIVTGLLGDETSDSVTILQAEAKTMTIDRADIEQLKTLTTSLMPEGLETGITPPQMRSLIAYLQQN